MKIKTILYIFLLIIVSSFCYSSPDEIFQVGIIRNATNNNLTEAVMDVYINFTNTSTGALVYEQTQSDQNIDDGVYHTVFDSIEHHWFLSPLSFIIKIGNEIFTQKSIIPVPVSHASYIANDSYHLGGISSSTYVDTTELDNGSIIRDSNTSWVVAIDSLFNNANFTSLYDSITSRFNKENMTTAYPNLDTDSTDDLDLTTLDNVTVVRTYNTTWITNNIASTYVDTTELDNGSIIRDFNTSWITNNQLITGNTSDEIKETINVSEYYQIKIEWANILNRFITAVDNVWLYMSGTTIYFNQTKADIVFINETELDIESELETQLTDVTNVYTNNDGNLGNSSDEMKSAINESGAFYDISSSDLICTDCIGGTEISELADADVSNTLTCSDLQAASEVVADSEVVNDISIATSYDLNISTTVNITASNGNIAMAGNLTIGGGLIYHNGSHTIMT